MTKDNLTQKDPIQLKSGDFGCPDCETRLIEGLIPYFVDDVFLGSFDGLVCPMCRYGLLSEDGYVESGKVAYRIGQIKQILEVDIFGKLFWQDSSNIQSTINALEIVSTYGEQEIKGESMPNDKRHIPKILIPSIL